MRTIRSLPPILRVILALATGLIGTTRADAGAVKFDGRFGRSDALPGPNFLIPADAGKQMGGNLFHSFAQFDLSAAEVASFQGPASVQNILARVTGGSPSSIDGTLRSEIADANLYFINPAGVMFGANARLEIGGAFTVTTADHLRLSDGGRFDARTPDNDVLTAAPVSAFGFVNAAPTPVSFQGSTLEIADNRAFAVVAGGISFDGVGLTGPGSRLELISVRSAGEARVGAKPAQPLDTSSFAHMGPIEARNFSVLSNSGPVGGKVVLRGGRLTMTDSSIISDTSGSGRGANLDAKMRGTMTLQNAALLTNVTGTGRAGNALVAANSIELYDGSLIGSGSSSNAGATAAAGSVNVKSQSLTVAGGSRIDASTFGLGAGGSISITADNAFVSDAFSGITSNSEAALGGPAGDVSAQIRFLTILDGGTIASTTFGAGRGGDVFVRADDAFISNFLGAGATGILAASEAPTKGGAGGNVRVESRLLAIHDAGVISAVTRGTGAGGNVDVSAQDTLIVGNDSGFGTGIFAASESNGAGGRGGNLRLQSESLEIRHGGQVSANTFGLGAGGNVSVQAGAIFLSTDGLDALTGITADSQNAGAGGAGGSVNVIADAIRIREEAQISANTFGQGAGGSVSITTGLLSISGEGPSSRSGVYASTNSFGAGGHGGGIEIAADTIRLNDGGRISASTFGRGDAGDITIAARNLRMSAPEETSAPGIFAQSFGGDAGSIRLFADSVKVGAHSLISATTYSHGKGGDILVSAGSLQVSGNVSGITASTSGSGNGGSIRLIADDIEISHGALVTTATDAAGRGGALEISTGTLSIFAGAEISASTFGNGAGGDVRIVADRFDFAGNIIDPAATAPAGIFIESQGHGDAGSVTIEANEGRIVGGAEISATARSTGSAGDLVLRVDHFVIDGAGASFGTGVLAETELSGRGGTVRVEADELSILHGGIISTSTFGSGDAGDVFVRADSMTLDGALEFGLLNGNTLFLGGISATTEGDAAFGHGGDISINANDLRLSDHASLSAGTSGPGDGGRIAVTADTLQLDRGAFIECASIGAGLAGGIFIRVEEPFLMSDGTVLRTTSAFTSAGVIEVRSDSDIRLNDSTITVQALQADAGSITLRAPDTIALIKSTLSAEAGNNGGNIFIDPAFIILDHSLLSANAAIGRGGNIFLRADSFLSSGSIITATGATSGTVEIAAPELDLVNSLVILPGTLVDASTQLRELCAQRLGLDFSSFLVIGRGGVSLSPDEALPSFVASEKRKHGKAERDAPEQ